MSRTSQDTLTNTEIYTIPHSYALPIQSDWRELFGQSLQRIFDFTFSLFAILFSSLLMLPIAILIKTQAKSAVLFSQDRPGLFGYPIRVYKFMTMYPNNDPILEKYLAENAEARHEWSVYRKLRTYDPRVTPIGRILRKTSLDELPQFFNVLKGEMSVVGPRPYIAQEFKDYNLNPRDVKLLLSVKPGVTGYWQTQKRNDASFMERVEMDLWYIKNRTILMDLMIIIKTVGVVISRKGS